MVVRFSYFGASALRSLTVLETVDESADARTLSTTYIIIIVIIIILCLNILIE